ncbi:uncharacterized protein J4E88_004276 [Alternaria novae-zelandiae]|uniref:uncharacterized protein n=1 Tax=Alternaria novae-zelandiae TaxID=430562 RepID=UPI0020C50F63|nr:uncharacterized protein J4E88_004276 [Alternaria novae-zelandiae]KAI4684835.1 hypothetical protein J4E88_004276 [Alternaria novae-zelandiae]
MALSQRSVRALDRLRTYSPPPTQWYNCPLTRRAAVLILLFPDRHGELKVVLTMRSAQLRNYAGQAALPGGKADTLDESPWDVARREADEEIGLPMNEEKLRGFTVEHLCELPANLAKTELGVRPCVAFLRPAETSSDVPASSDTNSLSVEERLMPRLDPREVAAVFTAPFHNFLRKGWEGEGPPPVQKDEPSAFDSLTTFRVFGMTARILVDAARVAYGEEPEFEHNSHHGDEEMIGRLLKMGRLSEVRKKGEVLTREVLKEASKI